jgi:adenylylsulfate kinase
MSSNALIPNPHPIKVARELQTTLRDTLLKPMNMHNDNQSMEGRNGAFSVSREGLTVWFTGLSSSGKTTLSRAVYDLLQESGQRVEILDGDAIRRELCKELGFSKRDRDENIRRIGFVASLLTRNGVVVLVSTISPYREIRQEMRERIGRFIEVHVNAPLAVCEQRDVKGLYRRARAGELKCFTGIDDPYEPPLNAEVVCRTDMESVEESAQKVLAAIYNLSSEREPRITESPRF